MENQKQDQQSDNLEQTEPGKGSFGLEQQQPGNESRDTDNNQLGGLDANRRASPLKRELNDIDDDDKPPFTD